MKRMMRILPVVVCVMALAAGCNKANETAATPAAAAVSVTRSISGAPSRPTRGSPTKRPIQARRHDLYLGRDRRDLAAGDAAGAVDVPGRPGRQGELREHRANRQGAHRVPHREAGWLPRRQVRGGGFAQRRPGRQQGFRGQIAGTRNQNLTRSAELERSSDRRPP